MNDYSIGTIDAVDLDDGEVFYKWVVRTMVGGFMVCDFGGQTEFMATEGLVVRADRDGGSPVIRRLPNGYLGQHYRFERRSQK